MAQAKVREIQVESESSFGVSYTVTEFSNGTFDCTCPHFKFRRPTNGCKHIQKVKTLPKAAAPPA